MMACRTNRCIEVKAGIAVLLMLIGIGCLLMLFAPPAKGEALLGYRPSCANLGSIAVDAVEYRNRGIPWPIFEKHMRDTLAQARKDPDSYVQSDADEKYIIDQMQRAWNSNVPSYEAGTAVFRDCMAKRI
jgi:hypothetical protein